MIKYTKMRDQKVILDDDYLNIEEPKSIALLRKFIKNKKHKCF